MLDVKQIIERVTARTKHAQDRERCSLYLSKTLLKEFKKASERIGSKASPMLEELMLEFIEETKKIKAQIILLFAFAMMQ